MPPIRAASFSSAVLAALAAGLGLLATRRLLRSSRGFLCSCSRFLNGSLGGFLGLSGSFLYGLLRLLGGHFSLFLPLYFTA